MSAEALSALDEGWDSDATEPIENKDITEARPPLRYLRSSWQWVWSHENSRVKQGLRTHVSLLPVRLIGEHMFGEYIASESSSVRGPAARPLAG